MTRRNLCRFALPLVAIAAATLAASGRADDPPPAAPAVCRWSLDDPPRDFAADLTALAGYDETLRKKAARALAARPDAEPYLRHYRATPVGRNDDLAAEALAALLEGRSGRLAERAAGWAKQGRIDLVLDAALLQPDGAHADPTTQFLFEFAQRARVAVNKLNGPAGNTLRRLSPSVKAFKEDVMRTNHRPVVRFHDPFGAVEAKLPAESPVPGFVCARSCVTPESLRYGWVVLTRDELKGTNKRSNQWEDCYIFHNGDLALDDCMTSFVVCDGDVTFVRGGCNGSIVIAGGSIGGAVEFGSSTLSARGDIDAPKSAATSDGLLLAGGKINLAPAKSGGPRRVEKAGLADDPFGVRYFRLADVGVAAEWAGGRLTVGELTAGSPLARHDVRAGDVVSRVNDRPLKSAQDFRRELRYSVAAGAAVFHLRRGEKDLTRVVYFRNGLEK